MPNIIENNIPTVYLLGKDQTVYIYLNGDGSLVKAENKVVRREGSERLVKSAKTFSFADSINKLVNPSAIENAVNVQTIYSRSEEIEQAEDSLIIDVHQGQNCILGFLDKNNENVMGGYMLSTFSEPVSYSDKGFWENTLSAAQTENYLQRYGQTDLTKVSQYFAAEKIDTMTTTALQSFEP